MLYSATRLVLAFLGLAFFSQFSAATLLTFDEPEVSFQQGYGTGDVYVESGFSLHNLSDPGRFGSFIRFNPDTQRVLSPNNGSIYVGITQYANPWLQSVSGDPFSLIALDIAEYNSGRRSRGFELTGITTTGEVLSARLGLDNLLDGPGGIPDFQNYELNWSNLVRLDFDSNAVSFDNIQVAYIPAPSMAALFGLAMVCLGISRRKTRRGRA